MNKYKITFYRKHCCVYQHLTCFLFSMWKKIIKIQANCPRLIKKCQLAADDIHSHSFQHFEGKRLKYCAQWAVHLIALKSVCAKARLNHALTTNYTALTFSCSTSELQLTLTDVWQVYRLSNRPQTRRLSWTIDSQTLAPSILLETSYWMAGQYLSHTKKYVQVAQYSRMSFQFLKSS